MKEDNLHNFCCKSNWSEMRDYLSSDATDEEKMRNIMDVSEGRWGDFPCLNMACKKRAPDDIVKSLIDIGGKELVMETNVNDITALHSACSFGGVSYNVIKMLVDVGGKDLVMAKNDRGSTALHKLCFFIDSNNMVAEKLRLLLEVGDANVLLSTQGIHGRTPLETTTDKSASDEINNLLTPNFNSNSYPANKNKTSSTIEIADNVTSITQSSQTLTTTNPRIKADPEKENTDPEKENTYLEKKNTNLEKDVAELALLSEQKVKSEKDNECWKSRGNNLTEICSEHKAKFQEAKDVIYAEGAKRKYAYTNEEEHEKSSTTASQSHSSKRSKAAKASNGTITITNTSQVWI